MMRKRTLATLVTTVVVALLVLSACGPKGADFAAGFKSSDPTTFVVLEFGGVDTLDTALAYDSASGEVLQNVYDTLVTYNREKKAELVPMLATEIPTEKNGGISADGLTYVFKIRKGVKFHTGEELTPEDVAFTFQRGLLQGGSNSP